MIPSSLLRLVALTAPAVLVGSVVCISGAHAASLPAQGGGATSTKAESESATAARLGHRVVVDAKTTETSMTWANPDGSFTSDFNVEPVRVRQGAAWVPVDTDLVVGSDGRVRPRATGVAVVLSNGGDGVALASLARDGKSFTMGGRARCPAPPCRRTSPRMPRCWQGWT